MRLLLAPRDPIRRGASAIFTKNLMLFRWSAMTTGGGSVVDDAKSEEVSCDPLPNELEEPDWSVDCPRPIYKIGNSLFVGVDNNETIHYRFRL